MFMLTESESYLSSLTEDIIVRNWIISPEVAVYDAI